MKIRKAAVLLMTFCLVLGTMAISAYAADEYPNVMTVSAGNGTFEDAVPEGVVSVTPVTGPDGAITVTTSEGSSTIKVKAPENHFVNGVRIAGHDDVLTGTQTLSDADVDVVVTYGLMTNMVRYTVNYTNAAGGTVPGLPESETFYGVVGDKPVVAYKYAEGYLPQAYNLTGTLSDGENVFTFVYYAVDAEGNVITVDDGTTTTTTVVTEGNDGDGGNAAGAGANAAGGATGAGANAADGANIGDNATPLADGPAQIVDLDDNTTPQSENAGDVTDSETPKAGLSGGAIAGIAAAVIAAAAAAFAVVRRRSEYEDDDEKEDEE